MMGEEEECDWIPQMSLGMAPLVTARVRERLASILVGGAILSALLESTFGGFQHARAENIGGALRLSRCWSACSELCS